MYWLNCDALINIEPSTRYSHWWHYLGSIMSRYLMTWWWLLLVTANLVLFFIWKLMMLQWKSVVAPLVMMWYRCWWYDDCVPHSFLLALQYSHWKIDIAIWRLPTIAQLQNPPTQIRTDDIVDIYCVLWWLLFYHLLTTCYHDYGDQWKPTHFDWESDIIINDDDNVFGILVVMMMIFDDGNIIEEKWLIPDIVVMPMTMTLFWWYPVSWRRYSTTIILLFPLVMTA